MRRILLILAVVLIASAGAMTAATAGPALFGPEVTYRPGVGVTDTNPADPVGVSVTGGTLEAVRLLTPEGREVQGALTEDRSGWGATEPLGYGRTYTWSGSATGADGRAVPLEGSFTTLTPQERMRGILNIGPGATVGIAAPVQIQFTGHVADRAAVERKLSVTTSVPVEGAWGWLPDENGGSRVHWRPREYWPSGTTVTVRAPLYGHDYGDGRYGATDLNSTFTIGRAQVVTADVATHRMIVTVDGEQVADYPASYGLESDPGRVTRSGIHVVTEKFTEKRMVSERYGYDAVQDWAVRISNNGEFVHASTDTLGAQGKENVTHGCINLAPADAEAYYHTALYGDPVEVRGSSVQLAERDGDFWDWTLSWEQWKRLSALSA
ncbi:L,D-transpeptidase [Pseudonocardia bannensis]|uniref:L,D-transpeptidase n=1 Tax=Pseudonocardia bannensis TaxID=630973 RepID=A0A848DLD4_9PSEU|nr:Ig-like domain-containing protein [Pseudonocardia bannensis]NMH93316.1 L,D-transpeptidase [Pseudonocardia bannensis]